MNKLINIVLSGLLWRKYKFLLVSLILLIVFVFVAGQIHSDYLAYAQTTEGVSVGWSFAVKWLAWIVAIVIFFAANHWVNERKQKQDSAQDKNSALQRILSWRAKAKPSKSNDKPASLQQQKEGLKAEHQASQKDPFAQLRTKDKLRSYADLIIEKKEKE